MESLKNLGLGVLAVGGGIILAPLFILATMMWCVAYIGSTFR
jgi:Na+-transporting methylmalonyl-CoA/oxaloacetate decarboxylase gamma subunit